jgi:lipopolysaccharide biosynthesis regulator YciM
MSRRQKRKSTEKAGVTIPRTALNERWVVVAVCVFLAAVVWLVFGQTLRHDFVNLDDGAYVYKNPQVSRGLTTEGIIWAFTHSHASNWHPLTWISHMLDCQFYGLNPGGHHLTNILLQAANAILLFLLLRQLTASLWRSAFVATVFAIHPLRVESVAWVAERKDLLSGLFFILTIWAYMRYVRGPRSAARYVLFLVLFAVGLMCKPMLVTVPFVLLALDYWPLRRIGAGNDSTITKFRLPREVILEKLPLLGLALASCVATLVAQQTAMQPLANISLPFRAGNAVIASVIYIRQMLWPSGLAAFYPLASGDIAVSRVLLSLLLLAGISVAVFLLRRRRYLLTGWLFYLIMLAPVIGILQVGSQAHADRYTYLPEIGLALLLTWTVADLSARWPYRRPLLSVLSVAIVAALTFSAHTQASYWKDSETLWTHALSRTSDNLTAELNLGEAVYKLGRVPEAIGHFERALQIDPNQASVYSSMGAALLEIGRPNESLATLQKAIELDPKNSDAHYNLGNTFLQMGRGNDAVAHYKRALELASDDIETMNNLAWTLATSPNALVRDGSKAVQVAERADTLTNRASPIISATLAAAYAEAARFPEAVRTAQRAIQLALNEGNESRASSVRAQLSAYESGKAFRDRRF